MISNVDVHYLANLYDVEVRTIQLWEEKFIEKNYESSRVERGEYDIIKFVRNVHKVQKEEIDILKNSMDEKLHALRVEGQKTDNRLKYLKLKKLERELISFDQARMAWVNETTIFRKNLIAMIPKLVTTLDGVDNQHKRHEIIMKEVHEVLNMLGNLKIIFDEEEEEEIMMELENSNVE